MEQNQTNSAKPKEPASKRLIFAVLGLVLVVVVIGLFLMLSGRNKQEKVTSKTPEATAIVTITNSGFVPSTLTVKKGQTVKWVNSDVSPHRVASNPHPTHTGLPGFDSKNNIDKDASYSFNFDKSGTFGYHDHLNPQTFNGVVVVQ